MPIGLIIKRIISTHNNNIPVNIPSHLYVLLDRNILCNCEREAKSNFLLESLAACSEHENEKPDLEMYFTVNLAFANHLDQLDETIDFPIERNWMHQMPISIEPFYMSQSLLQTPKTLREYLNQYQENRKSLDIKEKMMKEPTFNTFLSSYMVDVVMSLCTVFYWLFACFIEIQWSSVPETLFLRLSFQ